ncbi:putative DNA-binding transcriptional regulator YafY [Nocardiopsis mwathae]|uniref:Putative DNA-binding transcriptional regulator YafY n=1 Tax=Nocardiopsis mwathae TaxID=1472723 RepID=A0A7X0D780_9ACTN|nr:WYL domain-containing protein [Nocardiopsis mwathae]MBB6174362.1 putative DNA-binding transcriptional regulator YafY [Nocardiopsis mwathae]
MSDTSTRLLRLLALLQSRRDWSCADLSERLGVTPRTVRRDVQRLRDLGYPVHGTPGVAGGYRLGAGAVLPPLLLDDDEAVAVAVGLRTAAGGSVTGIEETSVRAMAKLEQVLPARLRRRANALHTFTVPLLRSAATVDADVITVIAGACRDSERLRFAYRDHTGSESRRLVEPHRMVNASGRWYLVAWDVDRDDWRTFRVDRIEPPLSTGPRVVPRTPPEDAGDLVRRGVSSEAYEFQARVILRVPVAVAEERVSALSGVLKPLDATSCELRTGAGTLDMLVLHLAMIGFEFEVVEPVELVEHIRAMAERLGRAVR